MTLKTCRCGKTQKNFMMDIGPFFVDECCTEAGYNHLGQKIMSSSKAEVGEPESETIEHLKKEVIKKVSQPKQVEPSKKRPYRRNGQINIKKD